MAIDVERQGERAERLTRYDGPPIDARLPQSAPPDSVCLRFIDPSADTTFNTAQVGVLEQELTPWVAVEDVAAQTESLLTFVRQFL